MPEVKVGIRQKRSVLARAHECCEYCRSQQKYSSDPFAAEHIVPRAAGGTSSLDNLALSCSGCNGHKFTHMFWTDSISGVETSLFHPRNHKWWDHFEWSSDFTLILGLTAIGRVTVTVLQMNRIGLINLRQVLFQAGKHPPDTTGQRT